MNRSKSAIRNVFFSIISAFVSLILTLINRKVLLYFLGSEMLGYESLFANIFSVLSLTEMGAGTVISYQLYKSVAEKNQEETNHLISIYKYLYRIVGILVFLIGIFLFFFLEYIVKNPTSSFVFIQKIYLIQLSATVVSYFLGYKRMLFISDQKEFVITKIDIFINFISQILKIAIIAFFQNYILYLIITVGKAIIVNLIVNWKAKKYYSSYQYIKVKKEHLKERKIFKDMFHFLSQKISGTIYYNTDNILISMILGVSTVGIYSNYYMIKNQVFHLTTKLFNPIQSSIGNFINDPNKKNQGESLFNALEIISYSFALIFACCLYNILQPFIELWYGKKYLLSHMVVLLITINAYIETLREIPYYFRSAFGQYEIDKKYMFIGAFLNIVLSIILGRIFGLVGILVGTVIGMIFLWHGVIYFIHKIYLEKSLITYYVKHLKYSIFSFLIIFICNKICSFIIISVFGIIVRVLICVSFPLIVIIFLFKNTESFQFYKNILNNYKK